ncbi:MAG TPA: glycosyltransferase family 39 protein [Polyangia bacterium]|nr:glycosyltransferase family 39 protein [Polyangia bacterium]
MGLLFAAIATALRLTWVLLVPSRPVGDFALYLESAAYLLEHGAFDSEFIYMPGYVLLLAAVQALGGGVLCAKLVGVVLSGAAAWPVFGIATRLFDRRAGVIAATLYTLWPAGIAVASVTGTDMPTAALLITATYLLVCLGDQRPWRAAVLFGLVLGLAATVRAVAVPLAALAVFYWLAAGARLPAALARTAAGCAVAALVLLPWGIRNQRVYGEFFLTDSHGGHTALVGSNPNSDGVYTRSLNQIFWKGTGYKLFDPPHRASDRAAYQLARSWAAFEPAFALGLVVAKADRLLTLERPLLYWPVYRQGVLPDGARAWFDAHRGDLERLVDGCWYFLVAAAAIGFVVALSRRHWRALALTLIPLALTALYASFFSEVRYHLAIAIFIFPFAGLALRTLIDGPGELFAGRLNRRDRRRLARELLGSLAVVILIFVGWPRLVSAGAAIRDRHRWAATVCTVGDRSQVCSWRAATPPPSPVRGVWNGVGLRPRADSEVAAVTALPLAAGQYRITATIDSALPSIEPSVDVTLRTGSNAVAEVALPAPAGAPAASVDAIVDHPGGLLEFRFAAAPIPGRPTSDFPSVWLSDLAVRVKD